MDRGNEQQRRRGRVEKYLKRFGTNWVQLGEAKGKHQVRLKTLSEFRRLFEEKGRFLLIQNPYAKGEFERAWTQPLVTGRASATSERESGH